MAHGLVGLWWWLIEGHCEEPLHYGGRRSGVQGPRSDDFVDRLHAGAGKGNRRV